ncbi:DsbC family protein [Pokkaliibacter sp. CJK22405]|uniref:DsbC family protein n=1 Tax=Pokkaliibacter sp. CJK22405 TaxID=3384615 RepID=UPI00398552B3
MKIRHLLLSFLMLITAVAQAAKSTPEEAITAALTKAYPDLPISSITPSEMPHLYEVMLATGDSLYASEDGSHFIVGNLYQTTDKGFRNLTEIKQQKSRAELMASVPDENAIIFPAKGEERSTLFVFTDVDCGYCRKLHSELGQLTSQGITVKYLAFPRTGLNTPTYDKMVAVWCSDDPQAAITAAKQGSVPGSAKCENPVAADYELGVTLGVTGTPTLITPDGQMIPGYMPANELVKSLGL